MSEQQDLIDYYTSSFSILHDYLSCPPSDFPWQQVLRSVQSKLERIMDQVDRTHSDVSRLEKPESDSLRELFVKHISARTGLSQDRALELVSDYIMSELRDPSSFGWNEPSLQKVIDFYYTERRRIADCITLLLRVVSEESEMIDQMDERFRACSQTVAYLVDKNLEKTAISQLQNASDFQVIKKSLDHNLLTSSQLESAIAFVTEQKLREKGSLLEMLFMLYYVQGDSKVGLSELMDTFHDLDYNQIDTHIIDLSREGQLSVARNTCLTLLILIEAFKIHNRELSKIKNTIQSLQGEQPHHAFILLSYLVFQPVGHVIRDVAWIKSIGQSWECTYPLITVMFDSKNMNYPFLGHRNNVRGYRAVVRDLLIAIASSPLFQPQTITALPMQFFDQYLKVLEAVIDPNMNLLIDEEGDSVDIIQQMFVRDVFSGSLSSLLKLLVTIFPAQPHLLQLLSLTIFDANSAYQVLNFLMDKQDYCWMKRSDTTLSEQIAEQFSQYNVSVDLSECKLIEMNGQSIYFSKNQFSGFQFCLRQLKNMLPTHEQLRFNKNTCESFLHFLGKIVTYGHPSIIQVIDSKFDSNENGDASTQCGNILLLVYCLIRQYVSDIKNNLQLICSCCRVILSFVRNRMLPHSIHTLVTKYVTLLMQQGYMSAILQFESAAGTYTATLTLLETVNLLVSQNILPQQDSLSLTTFICSNVFAVHDVWRYEKLDQRWSLAFKCLRVFNEIIGQTVWNTHGCSEKQTGIQLMQAFLRDGSLYRILFMFVGLGSSLLDAVLNTIKTDDAYILEYLILESLLLLESLLKYRICSISQIMDKSTPFETILFSQLVGKDQTPLIAATFQFIDNIYSTEIRVVACRIINSIAQLTEQYNPRPPSIASYLGAQAPFLIGKCLDCIESRGEDKDLKVAMFALIATTIQIQRGLGSLFLNPPQSGSDEEKVGCVDTIRKIIHSFQSESTEILLGALSVLLVIFQKGEDYEVIDKLNSTGETFWKDLMSMCDYFVNISDDRSQVARILAHTVHIFALNLFTDSNQLEYFRYKPGTDNDNDVERIEQLLNYAQEGIALITKCNDHINELGKLARQFGIADDLNSCIVVKGGIQILFNTTQLAQSLIIGVKDAELRKTILDGAETINKDLLCVEEHFTMFDAIYRLLSARTNSPSTALFPKVLKSLESMVAHNTKLLPLLEEKMNDVYLIASKMLVCVTSQSNESGPIDLVRSYREIEDDIQSILLWHLLSDRFEVCENILLVLHLMTGSMVDSEATESRAKVNERLQTREERLVPLIGVCLQKIPRVACRQICLSLLSMKKVNNLEYERGVLLFALNHIRNFNFGSDPTSVVQPKSSEASLDETQIVLDALNFLLSSVFQCEEAYINRTHDIIRSFSANINLSASVEMYKNEEQSVSFKMWKVVLKIMCTICQTSSPSNIDHVLAETIFDFCKTHERRLLFGLVDVWNASPRTLAAAEEAELTSMLMHALARLGLLNNLPSITDAILRSVLITSKVMMNPNISPVSPAERKSIFAENTSLSARFATEDLSWFTRVNVTLYSNLRALLSSITYLVVNGNRSLSSSVTEEHTSIHSILKSSRACCAALKKLSSRDFNSGQFLTISDVTLSSTVSTASSSIATVASTIEDYRVLLWSTILGALSESIAIVFVQLGKWHQTRQADTQVIRARIYLLAEIERTRKILSSVRAKVDNTIQEVHDSISSLISFLDSVTQKLDEMEEQRRSRQP